MPFFGTCIGLNVLVFLLGPMFCFLCFPIGFSVLFLVPLYFIHCSIPTAPLSSPMFYNFFASLLLSMFYSLCPSCVAQCPLRSVSVLVSMFDTLCPSVWPSVLFPLFRNWVQCSIPSASVFRPHFSFPSAPLSGPMFYSLLPLYWSPCSLLSASLHAISFCLSIDFHVIFSPPLFITQCCIPPVSVGVTMFQSLCPSVWPSVLFPLLLDWCQCSTPAASVFCPMFCSLCPSQERDGRDVPNPDDVLSQHRC